MVGTEEVARSIRRDKHDGILWTGELAEDIYLRRQTVGRDRFRFADYLPSLKSFLQRWTDRQESSRRMGTSIGPHLGRVQGDRLTPCSQQRASSARSS